VVQDVENLYSCVGLAGTRGTHHHGEARLHPRPDGLHLRHPTSRSPVGASPCCGPCFALSYLSLSRVSGLAPPQTTLQCPRCPDTEHNLLNKTALLKRKKERVPRSTSEKEEPDKNSIGTASRGQVTASTDYAQKAGFLCVCVSGRARRRGSVLPTFKQEIFKFQPTKEGNKAKAVKLLTQ
jgi:hypothetical protein